MDRQLSNKIYYIYILLSFMIVVIHSNCNFMLSVGEHHYYLSYNVQRCSAVLSDCAVPTFFMLSAFLLFRKYVLNDYFKVIKKKFFSLIIPYFIWSIIGFIFFNIIFHLILKQPIDFTFSEAVLDILLAKKDTPIWFIRSLFVFVVCSPLFYLAYKYLKHYSLLIFVATIILNLLLKFNYSGILMWLPMYFIGGYLGYFGININALKEKTYISISSLLAYFTFAICIVAFAVDDSGWVYYLYRVISPVMLWLAFDVLRVVYKYNAKDWMKVSSFMFFSHIIVLTLIRGLVFRILGKSNIMILIGSFIIMISTFIIVFGLADLLKKYAFPVYKVLSGGR